jgi:adenylate cyclase
MRALLLILAIFLTAPAIAQNNQELDSLVRALPAAKQDTNKLNMLLAIATMSCDSDPQQALRYSREAVDLAEGLHNKPALSSAYNVLGNCYRNVSDFPKALDAFFHSLRINEELNNKVNIARNAGNIGNLYRATGNYTKALEYMNKALAVNTTLDRKLGITNNLSDMGIVYCELKETNKALDCFNKALKIAGEDNDKEGVAIVLGNIANVHKMNDNFRQAIDVFGEALKINEELGRTPGIATNLVNLAELYYLAAVDSMNRYKDLVAASGGKQASLERAEKYYTRAISLFTELGALDPLSVTYKGLSKVYAAKGDYKTALEKNQQYYLLKDSIYSVDNRVKLSNLGAQRAEQEKLQQEKLTKLMATKRRNEALLFTAGIIMLLIFTAFVVRERRRSDKLLLNILPEEVASELKQKGNAAARHFEDVTVIFTDFEDFTTASERMTPQQLVDELHICFKSFDEIISKYTIEKIKTIGDAYLAVGGVPNPDKRHAEHVILAALEIAQFMSIRQQQLGDKTFRVRIGVHSGPIVAGIVGLKKFAYDIWGDTVNTAARMEQNSVAGRINISEATYELVKTQFDCSYRGEITAKNKGALKMYFVERELSKAERTTLHEQASFTTPDSV